MKSLFSLNKSMLAAAACGLMVAVASGGAAAQGNGDKIVMKLGHTLAPENHYQLTALEFARLVKQKTGGKVEVQVFPQSQLGGEVQMTQALRTGTQDMMLSAQAAVVNTIKQWEIFDIPYLFNSIDEANHVLQGPVGRKFLDMMEPANMVGLAWISVGERNLFTAKKPVDNVNDLKDLKVRVMQSPGYLAGYKALGANPTPLAYNQLFLALSQGLVDGADTSPEQFMQDKFADVAKHYYITHVNYLPVVMAISKTTWNKLNPEQQKAVRESAQQAAQFDLKEYHRQYDDALAQMKKRGVEVKVLDTTQWSARTAAARNEILARIPDGPANYKEIMAAKAAAAR
ncbi:TRAP transporter substrate-binding protein DctP [Ramlibacter ginsenosidimutans]